MTVKSGIADRTRLWLLLALILIAFGRGVWALGNKSLWWDESLTLHRAQETVTYVLSNKIVLTDNIHTVDTVDNHPPLYFLLQWGAVRLFGQSEFALRLLSLVAIVLIVPLLYITGRQLVDRRTGLAAAALGAISPMYLWYGQEARMYALLALLSLLSFFFFYHAFLDPSERLASRRLWPWVAAYLLSSACLTLTHYLGSLLIAFELLVLGFIALRQVSKRRVLVLTILIMSLLVLLLLLYALTTYPITTSQAGFRFVPPFVLLRDLLNSFSLGLSADVGNWYVVLIDLTFLFLLVLGIFRLLRPGASSAWKRAGWLLIGFLGVPTLLMYLLSYVRPAYMNSRHLIFITPAFNLLVASGLAFCRGRKVLIGLLIWLVVVGGVSYSTWNYFYDPTYDKDHHREWGEFLLEHVRPGDVVVVDPPHIADLYHYYADSGVPWVGLPLLNSSRQETAAELEQLLEEYDRVWLALSHTPPWGDRHRMPEQWLNENAFRVAYKGFESYASNVLVAGYLPGWPSVPGLPDDAYPTDIWPTPELQLAGYRLVSAPQPGKVLHIELFWAVDQPIPEEASVVLRLVDGEGHLWSQREQCPFNGLYPMWQWEPGLLLRDEHELPIPLGTPPGTYELELKLVSRPAPEGCFGPPGPTIPPAFAPPQTDRGDRVLLGTVDVPRAEAPADKDVLDFERGHHVRFDGLELIGSTLAPQQLRPGERLNVILYWQARQSQLPDARFRLRLVDAAGDVRREASIRPVGDTYPTDRWLAGDRYKGQIWLSLPEDLPAGRYWVELMPEPPLQQTGAWAMLRGLLGLGETGVRLGAVEVQSRSSAPPATQGAFVPLPTDVAPSHPMLATLGDRVRFLGYDLDTDSVRAGEPLSFTLYWQALRQMGESYTVFTHLLEPSGEIVGQKDSIPRQGAYPTTLWQPGEVITDSYSFTVVPDAPPGNSLLEVGMYLLETDTRLPVTDEQGQPVSDDRIVLSDVTVLPALPLPTVVPEKLHVVYLPLVEASR
jgi:uncharacterized membrane protein